MSKIIKRMSFFPGMSFSQNKQTPTSKIIQDLGWGHWGIGVGILGYWGGTYNELMGSLMGQLMIGSPTGD